MLSQEKCERVNDQMPEGGGLDNPDCFEARQAPTALSDKRGDSYGDCQHSLSWGSLEQIRRAQWHGKRGQRGLLSPLQRSIRALRRRFQDGGAGVQVSGPKAAARFVSHLPVPIKVPEQFWERNRGSGKTPLTLRPFTN